MSDFKSGLKIDKANINEHIERIAVEVYDIGLLVATKEENLEIAIESLEIIEGKIRKLIHNKYRNMSASKQPKEAQIKARLMTDEDYLTQKIKVRKEKKQLAKAHARKKALQAKLKAIELQTVLISSERKASGIRKK